jgi:hypothetical protein
VTDPKPLPEPPRLVGSTDIRARILALREAQAIQKKEDTR